MKNIKMRVRQGSEHLEALQSGGMMENSNKPSTQHIFSVERHVRQEKEIVLLVCSHEDQQDLSLGKMFCTTLQLLSDKVFFSINKTDTIIINL